MKNTECYLGNFVCILGFGLETHFAFRHFWEIRKKSICFLYTLQLILQ
jgi:hypothetical protein